MSSSDPRDKSLEKIATSIERMCHSLTQIQMDIAWFKASRLAESEMKLRAAVTAQESTTDPS